MMSTAWTPECVGSLRDRNSIAGLFFSFLFLGGASVESGLWMRVRKGKSDDGIGAWEAGVKLDTKMGSALLDPRHQRAYTRADANGRVDG